MKKKILVTGSEGFIGKHFCQKYEKKFNITKLDNFSRSGKSRKQNNSNVNGSVFDKKKLKKLIESADIILHLAAINGTKNFYERPKDVFETSYRGILNIHDAILETGFKGKVLIASSGEVYGYPKKIPTDEKSDMVVHDIYNNRYSYGGGKICQDLLSRYMISSLVQSCIIFRPHNVYGPNMGYDHVIPELFLKTLSGGKKLKIQGTGNETRSFCYIDDFLNGLELLISKKFNGFHIFNIGNDKEIKIINLVKRIIHLSGKNKKVTKGKLTKWSVKRRKPDLKEIKKLGYKARVNIDQGLKTFLTHDKKISTLF